MTAQPAPAFKHVFSLANRLAKQGYGHEDVYVKLKDYGLTREEARRIVLGKKQ